MRWLELTLAALLAWTSVTVARASDATPRASATGATPPTSAGQELPKEKMTKLGLYVTAKEAYEQWLADPSKVKILDVRTTEEYLFVGHPPMAWNVPAYLQVYEWDPKGNWFPMKPNPEFESRAKELFAPEDTILVTCRSGGRSALAVDRLAAAGFKNVYNIVDGFEGDSIEEPGSLFVGLRQKNGWKNSGIPWTYEVDPGRVVVPKSR